MPRYWILLGCTVLLSALAADVAHGQPASTDLHGDPLPPGAVARLGTVRFRHPSAIVFAAFLPDGKRVLSVSDGGVLSVWEFPSGKEIRRLEMLTNSAALVTNATLSPNGKHLTAFCSDGFLRIWDWSTARELGKVANVANVAKTTAGRSSLLAMILSRTTQSNGGTVYSPDDRTLMLFGGSRVLQLVDLATGKEIAPSPGHTDPLIAIWCSPDGGTILTKDAKVTHTWKAATGMGLGTLPLKLPPAPGSPTGSPTVVSPDGRLGVTVALFATPAEMQAAKVQEAVLFDTASGKELGKIALDVDRAFVYRRLILFSPDSKLLAVHTVAAQQKINLYDVPSGKLLRALDLGPAAAPVKGGRPGFGPPGGGGLGGRGPRGTPPQNMLFSPDARALAFQARPGGSIVVMDTVTGKQKAVLTPNEDSPTMQGAFSPDGRCLALEQPDGTVTFYELATGRPRGTYGNALPPAPDAKGLSFEDFLSGPALVERPRASFAIAPDNRLLALAGPRGSLHILDVLTGKTLKVFKGHTAAVSAVAFAAHGKTLVSASDDTTALIWDMTRVARPALPAKVLTPGQLEQSWQALAAPDAAKGFAALGEFAAAPQEAVAWIKEHVKPVAPLDQKRVEVLMKQLDDGRFKVRANATIELLKVGGVALPVIEKALAGNLSPETQQRLEELRDKMTGLVLEGDRLRAVRAVEILEVIGTPQARQVLRALAGGAPGALVTTSAQAALKR